MFRRVASLALLTLFTQRAQAVPTLAPDSLQALNLAKASIALPSVAGPGNQTPKVADLYRNALIKGGFAASTITVTLVNDTAYLIFRWPGSDRHLKPLVISGHMDVVAPNPTDWAQNPFTPRVDDTYLYGRGAIDMKLSNALAITALIHLHQRGFVPKRDIVFALSGDEETTRKTSRLIAEKLNDADRVLNIDLGGGMLDEVTGRPLYFTWSAAEKTYADYTLVATNPGGHPSEPRANNAIITLAAALLKVHAYKFTPEVNALTRSYFMNAARFSPRPLQNAMRRFAASPGDPKAIATLRADPSLIGAIETTCVVTVISGGHAKNALPQHAEANINCRIFPGRSRRDVRNELTRVIGDPEVTVSDQSPESVETEPSPLEPAFANAVTQAVHAAYPDLPVFPSMNSGASDSMWFRRSGVPSYGASPIFVKPSDGWSQGLAERSPLSTITPGLHFLISLIPALA